MPTQAKKLTEQTHPGYSDAKWSRFLSAYQGGDDYAGSVLQMHPREESADYARRKAQAYAMNYCQRVVDTRVAYLSKEQLDVECPQEIEQYAKDVDRAGTSIDGVSQEIAQTSMIAGSAIIVVDRPRAEEEFVSRADQEAKGDRPYWTILSPEALQNFGVDDKGEFEWALIKQPSKTMALSVESGMPKLEEKEGPAWVLWTRDLIYWYDSEGNLYGEPLENPIGVVPVVNVPYKRDSSDKWGYGVSLLTDIEPIQRRIVNDYSLFDQILDDQTFSQLVAPGGLKPEKKKGTDGKIEQVKPKVGTKSVLETPVDATHLPTFISPDSAQGALVLQGLKDKKEEIYQLAELKRGNAVENTNPASGVSKAFDFLDTNKSLARQAEGLAKGLERALWLTALWVDPGRYRDPAEYTVSYPSDFGVETSGELVDELQKLRGGMASNPPTVEEEYFIKLYKTRFPNAPQKEMDKAEAMIRAYFTGDQSERTVLPEKQSLGAIPDAEQAEPIEPSD